MTARTAILQIYFEFFPLNRKAIDSKLGRKYQSDLEIKLAKIVSKEEIQDGHHSRHSENLF